MITTKSFLCFVVLVFWSLSSVALATDGGYDYGGLANDNNKGNNNNNVSTDNYKKLLLRDKNSPLRGGSNNAGDKRRALQGKVKELAVLYWNGITNVVQSLLTRQGLTPCPSVPCEPTTAPSPAPTTPAPTTPAPTTTAPSPAPTTPGETPAPTPAPTPRGHAWYVGVGTCDSICQDNVGSTCTALGATPTTQQNLITTDVKTEFVLNLLEQSLS